MRITCGEVPFENLVRFMQKCSEVPAKQKEQVFLHFLDNSVPRPSPDIFQIFRLLLPAEDAERVRFGLKEDSLAKVLVDAVGINAESANAKAAKNWKKGNFSAGNFPEVMEHFLLSGACLPHDDPRAKSTPVGEVNALLDRLAQADKKEQQAAVMRQFFACCSARQVKWLLRIIVKDLKIGMTKDRMLRLFHPDALDLLNITNNLKQVCEELASPTYRMARKDIMPGCAIKMQLCQRANSLEEAFGRMRGRPFSTEVKLDGYRLQIHVKDDEVMYFSRRGREHGRLSDYVVFDEVVHRQVSLAEPGDAVILDGELVVWNKARGVFEPFGGVRSAMIAARENVPPEHVLGTSRDGWQGTEGAASDQDGNGPGNVEGSSQPQRQQEQEPCGSDDEPTAGDIELVYVAFDILFAGKESIITRPLHERHALLKDAISCIAADQPGVPCNGSCVAGRVVALLPDQPLPLPLPGTAVVAPPAGGNQEGKEGNGAAVSCGAVPELVLSRTGRTLADMQRMYDVAISRQDEGIVCKQLESPWKPDDRSGTWVKMKPDYTEQQEIDCVIIAVYLGGGRRGGQISEFLLALLEDVHTMRWCSFCKVGTGFSNVERQQLGEKLQPFLMRNGPGVRPPSCYRLTGKEERPDFWVTNPQRSLVVEVKSDIRTIISKVYAAPYSLRFPRITKICWDRTATDITTCAEVERVVLENKGRLTERKAGVGGKGGKRGPVGRQAAAARAAAKRRQQRSGVVGAARLPDVSGVERRANAPLEGKGVHVINYCGDNLTQAERDAAKQRIGEMLARNGAKQVAAPLRTTDYVLADHLGSGRVRWLHQAEAGSSSNAQAAYDVVSLHWLEAVDEAGEELPVMPRHRLYLTYATRLKLAAEQPGADKGRECDIYGNPFCLEVNAEDVEALLHRLIPDSKLAEFQGQLASGEQQQQQQLERATTLELAVAQQQGDTPGPDEPSQHNGSTAAAAPKTLRSVVQEVQLQLQLEAGWADSSATLFAHCCLLFVPIDTTAAGSCSAAAGVGGQAAGGCASSGSGGAAGLAEAAAWAQGDTAAAASGEAAAQAAVAPAAAAGSSGSDSDIILFGCAAKAQQLAASMQSKLAAQQLVDVKLSVMLHGGLVAETYVPQVTHIVLWPVGQQQQQHSAWLLRAGDARTAVGDWDRPSGVMGWPEELLPQQAQQLPVPAALLLRQLAGMAEAAAAATAAAAAAAAAAHKGGGLHRAGKRKVKFGPAPPENAAAAAAAAVCNGAGGGATGSQLGGQEGFGFGGTQWGPQAAAGRLGLSQALMGMQAGGAAQKGEEVPAAAAAPQLSPAGLKKLRLIRRRLIAAHSSSLTPSPSPAAAAAQPGSGSSNGSRRISRSRAKVLQLPALHLVGPCWVTDSLANLARQQQEEQQGRQAVVRRQSELLYEPTVLLKQQPVAVDGATGAAPAAAAVPAADVHSWPWQDLGLTAGGGGSSSSDSAAGETSGHSSDELPQKKRQKAVRSRAAGGSTTRACSRPAAGAADDGSAEYQQQQAKRRSRRTAAAAEVRGEAGEGPAGAAAGGKRSKGAKARGRGSGRGKSRGGGIGQRMQLRSHDESGGEQEGTAGGLQGGRSSSMSEGAAVRQTASNADWAAGRQFASNADGGASSNGELEHEAAAAASGRKADGGRRGRERWAADAAQGDDERPPGWLEDEEGEGRQQQQQQQQQDKHKQQQEGPASTDEDAAAAGEGGAAAAPTRRLPAACLRPPLPQQQQLALKPAAVQAAATGRRQLTSRLLDDDEECYNRPAAAAAAATSAFLASLPAAGGAGRTAVAAGRGGGSLFSRFLDSDDDDGVGGGHSRALAASNTSQQVVAVPATAAAAAPALKLQAQLAVTGSAGAPAAATQQQRQPVAPAAGAAAAAAEPVVQQSAGATAGTKKRSLTELKARMHKQL